MRQGCIADAALCLGVELALNHRLLTRRQRECLSLARRGLTSLQIAAELGISHRTVNQYIGDACRRLFARNRAQAVAEAVLRGEI